MQDRDDRDLLVARGNVELNHQLLQAIDVGLRVDKDQRVGAPEGINDPVFGNELLQQLSHVARLDVFQSHHVGDEHVRGVVFGVIDQGNRRLAGILCGNYFPSVFADWNGCKTLEQQHGIKNLQRFGGRDSGWQQQRHFAFDGAIDDEVSSGDLADCFN